MNVTLTAPSGVNKLYDREGTAYIVDASSQISAPVKFISDFLEVGCSLSAIDASLGNVTNDAQTKAAIVPNTAPSAGEILIGNQGGTAYAKHAISGDATLAYGGGLTIAAKAVTLAKMNDMATASLIYRKTAGAGAPEVNSLATLKTDLALSGADLTDASITAAKLANGAGWAAMLTAGLGASAAYPKTTDGLHSLAAGTAGAKTVLFIVTVTQAFVTSDTDTQPTFTIGEHDGAANKFMASSVLTDATLGQIKIFAGSLTASKALEITAVAAVGTGTGAISVMALILPAAS